MAASYGGKPFKEAVEFFRQKVRLPTRTWHDIQHGAFARAFTVAGATKDELLADFQESILRAMQEGTTLETFREHFDRIVERHGWVYRGGRNWRSRVIFETNLRTAYMAGRYKQLTTTSMLKNRPYWMYKHGDSRVPRPLHLAWDGLVLAASDPWWETNFPPNGWGCKCTVFSLSRRDLERMGKSGPDQAPPLDLEERALGEGGPIVSVPRGVDPGWGYNVGTAAWGRSEALRLMSDPGPWRELEERLPALQGALPIQRARARPGPAASGEAELRAALSRALDMAEGEDAAELAAPGGGAPVVVTQALVDHMLARPALQDGRERYFPLIRELIEDPQEIWVSFAQSEATGRVALRQRFLRAVAIGAEIALGMVAELDQGQLAGWWLYPGEPERLEYLRRGLNVYRRRR